jgi:hypothetical protein
MQSWGSQISLVRYIFKRETACSPGAARLHLLGTYLHGGLHEVLEQPDLTCQVHGRLLAVLGQPDLTCQVHIYTGDCMQSWGSQISLVRNIFTRETACSPGAARSHLSGTYLHGGLHEVLGQPDLTCQVHGRLHAVLGQPDLTWQVHIYTGDCMQSWGRQISLVRYIFTRETACSPGVGRSHLSGTYLHGRLHKIK